MLLLLDKMTSTAIVNDADHRLNLFLMSILTVAEGELPRAIAHYFQNRFLLFDIYRRVHFFRLLLIRNSIRTCFSVRIWRRQIVARRECLRSSNVVVVAHVILRFRSKVEAFIQLILSIVLESNAVALFQTVELLQSLIGLLVDAEQSLDAFANSLIAVGEDERRAEIGEKDEKYREEAQTRFIDDALLAMNQREKAVREISEEEHNHD